MYLRSDDQSLPMYFSFSFNASSDASALFFRQLFSVLLLHGVRFITFFTSMSPSNPLALAQFLLLQSLALCLFWCLHLDSHISQQAVMSVLPLQFDRADYPSKGGTCAFLPGHFLVSCLYFQTYCCPQSVCLWSKGAPSGPSWDLEIRFPPGHFWGCVHSVPHSLKGHSVQGVGVSHDYLWFPPFICCVSFLAEEWNYWLHLFFPC